MKTAVILHGKPDKDKYYADSGPSESNGEWLPWLQKQLIIRGVLAQTPEMPKPYEPYYDAWREVFERFEINEKTILVGHSCGAGFLVRWLSERPLVKVGKVVLVAPSLGIDWDHKGFFDFEMDPKLVKRTMGLSILAAKDDRPAIMEAAHKIADTIPGVHLQELETGGHFTQESMGKLDFPELLQEILR